MAPGAPGADPGAGGLDLVPRGERHGFFRRMHEDFLCYQPAGYQLPGGAKGVKLELIKRNAYWKYELLEPVNQGRVALRKALRRSRIEGRDIVGDGIEIGDRILGPVDAAQVSRRRAAWAEASRCPTIAASASPPRAR